MIYKTKVWQDK